MPRHATSVNRLPNQMSTVGIGPAALAIAVPTKRPGTAAASKSTKTSRHSETRKFTCP